MIYDAKRVSNRAASQDAREVSRAPKESSFESGVDGGKPKGRKRHIIVNTMGCLLAVWVHAANMFDGKAVRQVITHLFLLLQTVKIMWADGGYSGAELFNRVSSQFDCQLETVKKKKTLIFSDPGHETFRHILI